VRIDQRTNLPIGAPTVLKDLPAALTVGLGWVWVTQQTASAVVRLDPRTGQIVGPPRPVGDGTSQVATADRMLWVATAGGEVARLYP
jgi:streptogramin lyase